MNCRFFLYITLLGFFCGNIFGADYKSKNPKAPYWDLILVDQSFRQSLSLEKPPCRLSFFQLDTCKEEQKCKNLSLVKKDDEKAWLLACKITNDPYLGKIVMSTESDDVAFMKDLAGVIAVTEDEKKFAHIGVLLEKFKGNKTVYGKIEIAEIKKLIPKICVISNSDSVLAHKSSSDEETNLFSSGEFARFCNTAPASPSVLADTGCSDNESASISPRINNDDFGGDETDDERCVLNAKTKHIFGLAFCVLLMGTYFNLH